MALKLTRVFLGNFPMNTRMLKPKVCNQSIEAESYATKEGKSDDIDEMKRALKAKFPLAKSINVADISGGCGDMIEVSIETVEFKGLTVVKQHRLVNEVLKEHLKDMHGVVIHTTIPPQSMR